MTATTSIRFHTVEELDNEIEKLHQEYRNEFGQGYPIELYYIDWTKNQIIYKDGDPLKIQFMYER